MHKRTREEEVSRKKQVALMEAQVKELRSRKASLALEKYNVEGLFKQLSTDVAVLKADAALLDQELAHGKQHVDRLLEARSKMGQEVVALNQELSNLKERVRKKRTQYVEMRELDAKLDKKLRSDEKKGLRLKLEELVREETEAEEEIRAKKLNLQKLKAESVQLQALVDQQDQIHTSLQNKHQLFQDKGRDLQVQVLKQEDEEAKLSAEMSAKQTVIRQKKAELKEVEAAVQVLDRKLLEAKGAKEKRERELEKLHSDIEALVDRFDKTESALKEVNKSMQSVKLAVADHQAKKADQVEQVETLQHENEQLAKKLNDLRAMCARKSEERVRAQARVVEVNKEICKVKEELKESQRLIEETKRRDVQERSTNAQLQSTLKLLVRETQKVRENVDTLSEEKDSREKHLAQLHLDISALSEAEEDAARRVEALQQLVSDRKTEADRLQTEMDEWTERLSQLQTLEPKENLYSNLELPVPAVVVLPTRSIKSKRSWFKKKRQQ